MPVEQVLSSYILRLTHKLSRLSIELRDVRSGETLQFGSLEQLSRHLEAALAHSTRPPPAPAPEERG